MNDQGKVKFKETRATWGTGKGALVGGGGVGPFVAAVLGAPAAGSSAALPSARSRRSCATRASMTGQLKGLGEDLTPGSAAIVTLVPETAQTAVENDLHGSGASRRDREGHRLRPRKHARRRGVGGRNHAGGRDRVCEGSCHSGPGRWVTAAPHRLSRSSFGLALPRRRQCLPDGSRWGGRGRLARPYVVGARYRLEALGFRRMLRNLQVDHNVPRTPQMTSQPPMG